MNDTRTYIGAFAECKNQLKQETIMLRRCPNPGCKRHNKQYSLAVNFCDICGSPLEGFTTLTLAVSTPTVDAWRVSEAIDEALTYATMDNDAVTIWMPNLRNENPVSVEVEEGKYLVLEAMTAADHMTNFLDRYGDALKHLQATYGEDSVRVRWGVVCYSR